MLKPSARIMSRPSSVIRSGPHGVHPNPVHTPGIHHVLQVGLHLLLNHFLQRAGCGGEGQIQDEGTVLIPAQTVEQAEVNNINAELRVNDLLEGFLNFLLRGARACTVSVMSAASC